MKNYYQILGIKSDANSSDIKNAYKKLALKFHPDKNNGDNFFEELFKDIQEAYECLSDNNRKENYDHQFNTFFEKKSQPKQDEYSKPSKPESIKKEKEQESSLVIPFSIFAIIIFAVIFIASKSRSSTEINSIENNSALAPAPVTVSEPMNQAPLENIPVNTVESIKEVQSYENNNDNVTETVVIENTSDLSSEDNEVIKFLKEYYKFYDRDHIFRKPLVKKIDDFNYEISIEECLSKGNFKNIENFWDAKVVEISRNENGELVMGRRFR